MVLLFDIGGTKTRIAVTKNSSSFESVEVFKTPQKFNDGIELFKSYAKARKFERAVGGIRGRIIDNKTRTTDTSILKDWSKKPLAKKLRSILKANVRLENDADLAGLGEAVYGAGKGYEIVVYFTVSTGVGGVRIVDQKIDRSLLGFEPGKQILNWEKKSQTLESLISGTAIRKKFKVHPEDAPKSFYKKAARILAVGLHNSILHWSPDVVVLGGGIMHDIDLKLVKKHLADLSQTASLPILKKSQLKDQSGLFGALALTK